VLFAAGKYSDKGTELLNKAFGAELIRLSYSTDFWFFVVNVMFMQVTFIIQQ
jgi:hypothetical protein